MFGRRKERAVLAQSSPEEWRRQWQALVPPECRNVPVTVGEKTEIAFVQENHFAMMLQDGLLMEPSFFGVCEHFQRAGYHVIWLMRCTQDIGNGYLRRRKALRDGGFLWDWRSPTTNFGRWTSDNRYVTIRLQHRPLPEGAEPLSECREPVLQRVRWAESPDAGRLVPRRTKFETSPGPATPRDLANWLSGGFMTSED